MGTPPEHPIESSQPGQTNVDPEVLRFVEETNAAGGTYHRLDFGGGLVVDGEYDLREYLSKYGLPDNLDGASVLDVGTASGFFAIELAKRGGKVTAIDVNDPSFAEMAFRAAGVSVVYHQMDLFDLDESFGSFDLVFCGSVLLHVWDQFNAIRRLRSVCGGRLIVATAVMPNDWRWRRIPAAKFVGARAEENGREYWATWTPNRRGMLRMLRVGGFPNAEFRSEFRLRSLPGKQNFDVLHGVFHASP